MSQWRRFIYVVVDDFRLAKCALRRIDASTLFFTTSHQTRATQTHSSVEEGRLPCPEICFTPPLDGTISGQLDFFTLFGRGKEKSLIAGADQRGFTFLYDLGQRAVVSQVVLNRPKVYQTISIAVGDDLYVMDKNPCPDSFEALRFHDRQDWSWHCLPPPPYVFEPGYRPTRSIQSYTVVPSWPGPLIWVSTPGIGTYAFDVPSLHGLWSKAGDWVLPFLGRAEYLPEYGLWLGFSQETRMLCLANLSDASLECGPRLLHNDWEDLRVPQDWILNQSHLVHLGSGSFCVAKFFQIEHKETLLDGEIRTKIDDKFAVFTGLKLERLGGELRMIKHRSVRYRFGPMLNSWVF